MESLIGGIFPDLQFSIFLHGACCWRCSVISEWTEEVNEMHELFALVHWTCLAPAKTNKTSLWVAHCRIVIYLVFINVWNALPSTVNFSKLSVFRSSIAKVDFSSFLICNVHWLWSALRSYHASFSGSCQCPFLDLAVLLHYTALLYMTDVDWANKWWWIGQQWRCEIPTESHSAALSMFELLKINSRVSSETERA